MNNRGQLIIIAALLTAAILIAALVTTYSIMRSTPAQEQPQTLSAIDETNMALNQILGFTVGYYGSVLQVTGNQSYAKEQAEKYLMGGLEYIARLRPEFGASFSFNKTDLTLQVYWYTNKSYSFGKLSITYNLAALGVYGVVYKPSCRLNVEILNSTGNTIRLNVTKEKVNTEQSEPLLNLKSERFKLCYYNYATSMWGSTTPAEDQLSLNAGYYTINVTEEVNKYGFDPSSFVVEVEDQRGIKVVASSFNHITYTLNWSTIYAAANLKGASVAVEVLQNGTMRWLGQNMQNTTSLKPIPPLPIKAIHVNQTINGVNQETPFQLEDWASAYRVPLGLANNESIFNNRHMLVFLVDPSVSKVTIWWNGSDMAVQTPLAYTNRYFTSNTQLRTVSNGILNLKIDFSSLDGVASFKVESTMGSSTATAVFMRINSKTAHYGHSEPMYAILNGSVRAVLQHEVEWPEGGVPNCPNVYAQIVITLPANATYYTYQLRLMFMESQQARNVTDLCPIKIIVSTGQQRTENGTLNGYPLTSTAEGLFYNYSASYWAHHWSQFTSKTKGAGIMFTDEANKMMYFFDSITRDKTGALKVNSTARTIELLPIAIKPANFSQALDVSWSGAVATFDGTTPIYDESNKTGLWMIAEQPPAIAILAES
ncbi:MAG: hypothetical protein ACPLZY_01580 [Candidatus Norongarragalinales archaeon]